MVRSKQIFMDTSTGLDYTADINLTDSSTLSGIVDFTTTAGVGSWATVGGDNTPAFQARNTTAQTSLTSNTAYKVAYNTEDFDTDSAYDHSTNYRFTVPAGEGGKYYLHANCDGYANGNGSIQQAKMQFYVAC